MYTVVKYTTMGGKSCVRLCRSSCDWEHIRKCYPPTAMCRNFCLLRFRPGPIRPLLSNLVDGNFHSRHHVDTQLRVDTRSTYTHRPQVVSNSSRSRTKPPSSWITSACHYTQLHSLGDILNVNLNTVWCKKNS